MSQSGSGTREKLAYSCQVYIVAIDREKESQAAQLCRGKEDDDLDSYEHSGESLLSLVQPELANLSSHWFHALKDHALLSLPPGEWCVCDPTVHAEETGLIVGIL